MRKTKTKINIFFVIALLGYSVIALGGCAGREIKNIDSQGRNIICFGDSITFGYGADKGEDYPSALSNMVNAPVINAGVDGDTTPEALKRLRPDVLDREPLLVVIEFSGNDFLKKIPRQVTVANIREMIRQAQAQGAMAAIADISAGMFLKEYRAAFSKLAREEGAIFIPAILSGIITNPAMKSDFLHPNAKGYKIIAQKIHQIITPYLHQNRALRLSKK